MIACCRLQLQQQIVYMVCPNISLSNFQGSSAHSILLESVCSRNTFIISCDQMYTEFAEAMEEMGTCLLEKTAIDNDDDESGELSGSISTYYGEICMPAYILSTSVSKGHLLI